MRHLDHISSHSLGTQLIMLAHNPKVHGSGLATLVSIYTPIVINAYQNKHKFLGVKRR